ncbi:sulfate transporter [[Clostridium] sordellii]|uniref:SulP family inorganic anion transporter n=1 Tax=Paraclostridium sordellii TaxID=1505 RepID=UPI0005DF832C|nr:SulP family inorganic anion transporter [Paeniclostridium sordellii]CEN24769.1 sulfate transporter [[Clostridium] sordellii] [Paeniclostridium sordellii]
MLPKLFKMINNNELTKEQVGKDIVSGIIVAIIALPLSIALAISSGVSPEKGLITAIFAGFVISFLGGSKVQIGGPTGAFVVIVYGVVKTYGVTGLITATTMAGIILVIMGLLRFGSLIKYVPQTITVGFTSGIAVTLLTTQLKDFFGLEIKEVPAEFIGKIESYIHHISTFDIVSFLIGLACIFILVYWPKINKKIPASIIALILSTIIVNIFNLPADTIGTRFTHISSAIPKPQIPHMDIQTIISLIKPAMTIALLGAIESLLSCVVSDNMINDKHDSNMELVAQGLGNIASSIFGGIPATGAIARTAANVRSGGRSPIAGIVHAITLLLIMVILMPLAKLIPMTTLAAILIIVSYNMGEWKHFKELLSSDKSDVLVLIITFVFTVVFDLVFAIGVGMLVHYILKFVKDRSKKAEEEDEELEVA